MEHAVDAAAHVQRLGVGLDVDVGGLHADGVGDEAVHDLDDRGVVGEGRLVGDERLLLLAQLAQLAPRVEEGGAGLLERALGADDGAHVALGAQPDLVDGDDVEGVGHRQHQGPVVLQLEREDAPVDQVARQQGERLGREVDLVEVGDLEPQLRRQGLDEVLLRDESLADEHVTQPPPLDLLAARAASIWCWLTRPSATSRAPSRRRPAEIPSRPEGQACLHATLTFHSPRR